MAVFLLQEQAYSAKTMKEFALAIDEGGYGQIMNRIPSLGIANFMY
jgi:hypothetical protein